MTDLAALFEAEMRRERAIAAARRWISRCELPELRRSDVVEFLRRRREPAPEDELAGIADEALRRYMSGEARRVNTALRARRRSTAGGKFNARQGL
jgi:hypothetical protein